MKIDTNDLRKHYESLSDDALLEIDPVDLTPEAQLCLEEELKSRDLYEFDEAVPVPSDAPHADWLPDAFLLGIFQANRQTGQSIQAEDTFAAMTNAGIPCEIVAYQTADPDSDSPRRELRVMVPGGQALQAASMLDQEIRNEELEEGWKTYLEEMSEEDFQALTVESICGGMLDRAKRLQRAYERERANRSSSAK